MTKDELIKKAIPVLFEIDKMCPKGKKERYQAFGKLEKGLCGKNKKSLFSAAERQVNKTERKCPGTKRYCDILRGLLKTAESIKCGGS